MFLWEKHMRLVYKVCLLSLLIVFTFSIAIQESYGAGKSSDVPKVFIKSYNSGDFVSASKLFHIPASYTQEQVSHEKEATVKVLELIRNEFGKITSYRSPSGSYSFHRVMFGTGDLRYWNKHPRFTKVVYEVEFSKLGRGYITIALVNINKKTEIRQIIYGLPMNSPGAENNTSIIVNKIMSILQEGE